MRNYNNLKDAAKLPDNILEKVRLRAIQLNKYEDFWERGINLKLSYYKKYFHEESL